MTDMITPRAMGTDRARHDAVAKVTGTAPYAADHEQSERVHLHPVQATIARGRIASIDTSAAEALEGVVLTLTHLDAPRLASSDDSEMLILQSDEVAFRGQLIGAVVARTIETAREAASLVRVTYEEQPVDATLSAERDDLYAPDEVNAGHETDTASGDVDAAFEAAEVRLEQTYTTPMEHNNPMEPHTTVALWQEEHLTLWDSIQGAHTARSALAPLLGLEPEQLRVLAPFVGGGFGSKGKPHSHEVLAAMAAMRLPGLSVSFCVTRQQMFTLTGYRTPTISRVRLGSDRQGRLSAISHDVVEQSARLYEFAEQTAAPTRTMYAAPHRRTTHRLATLDVPVPFWMRAPGECPGMHALEVAMDELAIACELDPIELRVRNDTAVDPDTGLPFTHRDLVGCLREGARRFGWADRDPRPGRREGDWFVGTGVAASTYPALMMTGNVARVTYDGDRYRVEIGATDIGTGTWTALAQIAADALECPVEDVDLRIGDSDLPTGSLAGGSTGISSWGTTVVTAARAFREEHGRTPAAGATTQAEQPESDLTERFAPHSFGAQFAEVRVHADTGEVRVPRMLGVFSVGRVINPRTARSQLTGAMVMGLSMALHEHSVLDERWAHVVNHDLAGYHVAAHADVADIEAVWLDETDEHINPMGSRGVGEIGIVGASAAVANATYHATGIRVRELPLTPDLFLRGDPQRSAR